MGDLLASPDIKELIVVPHGALHEVPFAYLPFDGGSLALGATTFSFLMDNARLPT